MQNIDFLAKVRQEFDGLSNDLSRTAIGDTAEEILGDIADQYWDFFRRKIHQSYWNGIDHGASGNVKPKSSRANS